MFLIDLILILCVAALFGGIGFAAHSAVAGPAQMPPPKPTPPAVATPAPLSWGIQSADDMAEAVRLASAGWEPYAVTHDRGSGRQRYFLRRKQP